MGVFGPIEQDSLEVVSKLVNKLQMYRLPVAVGSDIPASRVGVET